MKPRILLAGALTLLASASGATAQISAPAINREVAFHNSIGAGVSIGTPYQRDAWFWGLSVDYNRIIALPWSMSAAWEWNITQREPIVSSDLGFSWSF